MTKMTAYGGKFFLCHALGLASLLDESRHVQTNSLMMQFFSFTVELRHILSRRVLLVLTSGI